MGSVGGGLVTIDGEATLDGKIKRDVLGLMGRTYLDGVIGGRAVAARREPRGDLYCGNWRTGQI